jgi:cysteine desulfurase
VIERLTTVVTRLREMSPLYEMVKEGVDLSKMQWVTH